MLGGGKMEVKIEKMQEMFNKDLQTLRSCMASGPITSWQIDGETLETMTDSLFLSFKIIVDGDCSHEIKRHLLLGRKAMTNLAY